MGPVLVLVWFLPLVCCSDRKLVPVAPGDDALLPCGGPRDAAVSLLAWSKPHLMADKYFVFFYRDDREYDNYQLPCFRGRVALRDPQMKDGDASVVLKNVTANDAGTYHCRVDSELTAIITLTVSGPSNRGHMDGLVAAVLVSAAVVGPSCC